MLNIEQSPNKTKNIAPAAAIAVLGMITGLIGALWFLTVRSSKQETKAIIVNGPAYLAQTTTQRKAKPRSAPARTARLHTVESDSGSDDSERPLIGEAFSRAAVRAIAVISNEPRGERARIALEEVEAEEDPDNVNELLMYSHLTNFWLGSESREMPECARELTILFRHRAFAPDLPTSCK